MTVPAEDSDESGRHLTDRCLEPERVEYWLSVGAQPSETVAQLLKKKGIHASEVRARAKQKTESE